MKHFLIVLLALMLLSACGGSSAKPDEATLRANMAEFWTAFQKKDVSKLYSMLTEEEKKTCSLSDFAGSILLAHAFLGESLQKAKYEIREVDIDGTKASFKTTLTLDGEPFSSDEDGVEEARWDGKRWVPAGESSTCGNDDDTAVSTGSRMPTPAISPTPANLRSTRETQGSTTLTSGGVTITVSRLAVSDYKEYYASLDAAGKRDLDSSNDSAGAVAIGVLYLKVENKNAARVSVYPDQGTVVVGTEQTDIDFFTSDDLGGEYFPGVVKEGRALFYIKRTPVAQITKVLYAVDSPFGSTSVGTDDPDFEFNLTVTPKSP